MTIPLLLLPNWPHQILDDMMVLLRQGWTQGTYARDIHGQCTDPHDDGARSFCVMGAAVRVAGEDRASLIVDIIRTEFKGRTGAQPAILMTKSLRKWTT